MSYAGAVLTALWFFGGVYEIADRLLHPRRRTETATIVVLVGFFGSLNLLAIGVVGEYLIRTFEEVKRRPRFIRRAMWHHGSGFDSPAEMESFVKRRRPLIGSDGVGVRVNKRSHHGHDSGSAEPCSKHYATTGCR